MWSWFDVKLMWCEADVKLMWGFDVNLVWCEARWSDVRVWCEAGDAASGTGRRARRADGRLKGRSRPTKDFKKDICKHSNKKKGVRISRFTRINQHIRRIHRICKNPQIRWTRHISLSFVLIASNTFFLTSSEVLQALEPGQEMELKSIEPTNWAQFL